MLNAEELKAISERAEALIRDGHLPDSYSEIYKRDVPALLSMIQEATAIITAASEYVIDPDAPMEMSMNAVYTIPKTATQQLEDRIAAIKKTKELANRIRSFLHP